MPKTTMSRTPKTTATGMKILFTSARIGQGSWAGPKINPEVHEFIDQMYMYLSTRCTCICPPDVHVFAHQMYMYLSPKCTCICATDVHVFIHQVYVCFYRMYMFLFTRCTFLTRNPTCSVLDMRN